MSSRRGRIRFKLLHSTFFGTEPGIAVLKMPPAQEGDVEIGEITEASGRPKYDIFLSHSGEQKAFVHELCKDLVDANWSPFFDRREGCLPYGQPFAGHICRAAQQCEVAVVVLSDDFFCKTAWPMMELEMLVQAPERKIVPLFYELTPSEVKNQDRRERWFTQWNEWAESNHRIDVNKWKEALRILKGMQGLVFYKDRGPVLFRQEIVDKLRSLVPQPNEVNIDEDTSAGNQRPIVHPEANAMQFPSWTSHLLEWGMIICFPFWLSALLKLYSVKVIVTLVVFFIVLIKVVPPIVRDIMQCLLESESLNLDSLSDRYRRHLN